MLGGTIQVKRYPEKMLASLVLLASAYSSFAQSPSEVLAKLGENLSIVRSASGTEPVGTEPIDVEVLLGASRSVISDALGNPDNCEQLDSECSSKSQWHFLFFYLPPDMLGGGPELWLDFNSAGEVEKAEWHFSR